MRATYFISFNAGVNYTEIFPSNEPKVKLVQEPGEIFWRWKVDSFKISKTRNATVFATLLSYFFDPTKFTTEIYYQIKENGTLTYSFISSVIKGKINTETSVYECSPDTNDGYRLILDQYERKWKDVGIDSIWGKSDEVYVPVKDNVVFVDANMSSFTDASGAVTWSSDGSVERVARNNVSVVPVDNNTVQIVITNFAGDSFLLRLVDGSFNIVSDSPVTVNANGVYLLTLNGSPADVQVEMSIGVGGAVNGSFSYEIFLPTVATSGGLLKDMLTAVFGVTHMNLSVTTISTYLWNDAVETGAPTAIANYMTANPTKDYVIEDTANWNKLWIARTDRFTTSKGTYFELSLKELMDLLKSKLRAYWFIDADGKFRIEHEKYFRSFTAQADITSSTYTSYRPEVDRRLYNYDLGEVFNQINYSELNQSNEDWQASPILYDTRAVNKSVLDVRLSCSTDIKYITSNPGDADSAGLTILKTFVSQGQYNVSIDASTKTATAYYPNARLGWYYLMGNYYDYFACATSGTVNGAAHTFDHVKEFMKQDKIGFHPASAIDWKKPFTLVQGTGWITELEYRPETGMCNMSVGFNPYA